MSEKIEGSTLPQESKSEKERIKEILENIKGGIDSLETQLTELPPNDRYKVEWLPKNIQEDIKLVKKYDGAIAFSEEITALEDRFNKIVKDFEVNVI